MLAVNNIATIGKNGQTTESLRIRSKMEDDLNNVE